MKIGDALLKLGIDDSELDGEVKKAVNNAKAQIRAAGAVLTGFGVATVGALSLATKAALDEQIGMQRLAASLKNVGVVYESVREEIDANMAAIQRKTSYGDGEQRDALNELITVTGDYSKSLQLLQLSTDLAASKQMSLASAAMIVGRAANGDTQLLTRYGIVVKEGATATEVLAQMQERFGGAAEAAANPLTQLQNTLGDLFEDIGANIIPLLKQFVDFVVNIVDGVRDWIKNNPELTRALTITAGAVGLVSLGLGTLLLLLPAITTAIHTLGVTASLWLAGLPVIIGAIVTATTLLYLNWDKVTKFLSDAWGKTVIFVLDWNRKLLDGWAILTKFMPSLSKAFSDASKQVQSLIDAEQARMDANKHLDIVKNWAKDATDAVKQTTEAKRNELNKQRVDAQKSHDDEIATLRKQYGVLEGYEKSLTKTKMDEARETTDAKRKALDKQMDNERRAYDERIGMINDEADARLKLIDQETAWAIEQVNRQINAIRSQQDAEQKAKRDKEQSDRQAELEARVTSATTDDERKQAQAELDAYLAELEEQRIREEREATIEGLRAQIDAIRNSAQINRDRIQEERDAKIRSEQEKLEATLKSLEIQKENLDEALKAELNRLEEERRAKERMTQLMLDDRLAKIEVEDAALAQHLEDELERIATHVEEVNTETAKLQDRTVRITTVYDSIGTGGGGGNAGNYKSQIEQTPRGVEFMQHGGIITQPSLLTRVGETRPYAMVAERGAERISPMGEPRTADIRVYMDTRMVAEAIGVPLVDIIRLKTGMRI